MPPSPRPPACFQGSTGEVVVMNSLPLCCSFISQNFLLRQVASYTSPPASLLQKLRNILGATSGVVYFTESPNFSLHYFFKMYSATILDQRKEDHPFFRTSVLAHMIKFVRRNTVIELKAVTSTLHGQLVYFVVSFMTAWPIPGPLITHHFCKKITRRRN